MSRPSNRKRIDYPARYRTHKFLAHIASRESELARQIIKDYSFDFLSLAPNIQERDLERGLTEHPRSLIPELGAIFGQGLSLIRAGISTSALR
jgi:predicted nuclease of restriction endonuclease-like (RecB) superfamily